MNNKGSESLRKEIQSEAFVKNLNASSKVESFWRMIGFVNEMNVLKDVLWNRNY